ncbi:hypothetical protein BHE74_00005662 [Ensete ventricosum]|nr:hypothetical protein BHE74_00005662 [Ensete ventricosum]
MCAGAGDHKATKAGDRGDHRGEVGGGMASLPLPLSEMGERLGVQRRKHGRAMVGPPSSRVLNYCSGLVLISASPNLTFFFFSLSFVLSTTSRSWKKPHHSLLLA